jgi:lysozyme
MTQGIDISHHNGTVNFTELAEAVGFVYIKACQGSTYVDPMFATNLKGATEVGMDHGVYHYLTPTDQASDQVAHFISTINNQVGQLPPVVDVEATYASGSHTEEWNLLPLAERVAKVVKFCEGVRAETAVTPMIYASPSFIEEMLGSDPSLAAYHYWVAEYGVDHPRIPKPFTEATCWQHSETGTVPGIADPNSVDLDILYW